MKKFYLNILTLSAMAVAMASCGDSDGDMPEVPESPQETTDPGAFIVNAGAQYANISGSLSYLNLTTSTMTNNVFFDANQQYIGDTF